MALRKALVTIGLVGALAALAPIDGEVGGPMGMAPPRGQNTQSYRGYPYPYPYYYRPNYYRPYAYRSYYYYPSLSFYAGPAYVDVAPGYYNYSAPPGSYSTPTAPQFEREVVFPEWRYLLQGDGDAVPYRWVWMPNPPEAKPPASQDPS